MTAEAWSTGGVGGTVAVLGDLDLAAVALTDAADLLETAARALAVAAHVTAWTPELAARAGTLADRAVGIDRRAHALRELAGDLAAAARAYLDAELAARGGITPSEALREGVADWFGTVAWAHRWGWGALAGATPVGMAATVARGERPWRPLLPPGPPPTSSWLRRDTVGMALASAGDGFDALAVALARAVSAAEALEPDVAGVAAEPQPPGGFAPPRDLETVVNRLGWLEREGDGRVAIETVTGAHGATRHIVLVPGTQDWGVTAANPADLQANLASVVGAESDATRTVVDAMAAHGIGPREPVLIAGHSQGGMVAAVVAAALADRYRVTHVVTAGSPTGRLELPSRTGALHLEHVRDPVPGLDARANPDRPNRVTVSHDRRRRADPAAPGGSRTVAQAHAIPGYAQTARLVDRGLTASTDAWMAGARPYLEGATSRVTAYRPVTG